MGLGFRVSRVFVGLVFSLVRSMIPLLPDSVEIASRNAGCDLARDVAVSGPADQRTEFRMFDRLPCARPD